MPSETSSNRFSFSQARTLIADLQQPKPAIYWIDFLLTILAGHALFASVGYCLRNLEWSAPVAAWTGIAYCGIVLLYLRATMFIHELVHLPKDSMQGFRVTWNLLCGIPFLLPSFLYYPHVEHHRRKHYGTDHDGEYLPLSHRSRWMIFLFMLQGLVVPPLAVFRFVVLSPVCWFIPGARQFIHRHASTMVIDPFYRRTDGGSKVMRVVVLQEAACFAFCIGFFSVHFSIGGLWNPMWLFVYALGVGGVTLNAMRTLGAHRWTNDSGEMSFQDQLLDTLNYPERPWFTELWGPIGTRYHALHHLFPRLPYHNLGEAHRRLMAGLPADSPYRETVRVSLWHAIYELWSRAGHSGRPHFVSTDDTGGQMVA